jgi:NAD(P)-dependent dehydrogenase (short-subunit alcohol dehydrogenase family)
LPGRDTCGKKVDGKRSDNPMELKIDDKVAIVTGAGNGIGRAIALRLAEEGAIVIGADLEGADVERVIAEVTSKGGKGLALQIDATDEKAVDDMLKKVLKAYGQIDILVNNVGGGGGSALVVNLPAEEWERTIAVNLRSAFLCSQAAARQMIKRKAGRIVNIASISGKVGESLVGAYCAAKFGVIGLTQVMAKELGRYSITVNAVCPGYVWTPGWKHLAEWLKANFSTMADKSPEQIFAERVKAETVLGRAQTPEDVASLVAYLASEEARNITGQAINVDGGAVMH